MPFIFGTYLVWQCLAYAEVRAALGQVFWLLCAIVVRPPWSSLVLGAGAVFLFQRAVASGLPFRCGGKMSRFIQSAESVNVRTQSLRLQRMFCPLKRGVRPAAVVTGANGGIGFWNAVDLCSLGFDVLLLCRSPSRGREAVERAVREATTLRKRLKDAPTTHIGSAHLVICDFECESSIRAAAAAVLERTDSGLRLAVIINNAGMFSPKLNQRTSFNDEKLIGVNFTGPVLLTELLLRERIAHVSSLSSPPVMNRFPLRVVNVSSIAHSWASFPSPCYGDTLQALTMCTRLQETDVVDCNTYGLSKLLLIQYTRALAMELKQTAPSADIEAVSVHPGAVLTDVFRELGWRAKVMPFLLRTIFKTAREGAESSLYAALAENIAPGAYVADCRDMSACVSPFARLGTASDAVTEFTRKRWSLSPSLS